MSVAKDMTNKIAEALQRGKFIVIEREIGAADGFPFVKDLFSGYTIYESTAAITNDNVFSKALPKHAGMLNIGTPPKTMMVYLSDMNGMLLSEVHREESSMDADIFSGMLNAVSNFVKDSIRQWSGEEEDDGGGLDALSYRDDKLGNLTIRIRRGGSGVLIVTYKGDISREIEVDIERSINWIDDNYIEKLKDWSGNTRDPFLDKISSFLKDVFFDSGNYEGVLDMDAILEKKEGIKEYLIELINGLHKENNKVAFLFDDVENIDPLSLELLRHVLESTDVPIICQYNTDVLEESSLNEGFSSMIRDYEDEDKCTQLSIRSDVDIEEVVREKLESVDQRALKLLRYAATAGTFDTDVLTLALKKEDLNVNEIINKLKDAGIIKNNRFANSRLMERAIEGIDEKEKKEIELRVAAALIKNGEPRYHIKIAQLLLPYASRYDIIRQKAVKYSIKAGDQYLRSFNTVSALKFYNSAIELDTDEDRKHELLEKTLILESLTWI